MAIHVDVVPSATVTFSARHEDGTSVEPAWGPVNHGVGSSNYDRPGNEWRMAFTLPVAGCWAIHIDAGEDRTGDIWIEVE